MHEDTTIEHALASLHDGQWFRWSDPTNKVYSNIVVIRAGIDLPSEESLLQILDALRADADATYRRSRLVELNRLRFDTEAAAAAFPAENYTAELAQIDTDIAEIVGGAG